MKRETNALLVLVACALLWPSSGDKAKKDNLPRLPGATLLVGWAPGPLMVTTPNSTRELDDSRVSQSIDPTITRDGKTVASARIRRVFPGPLAIGTYSVLESKWTEYQTEYKYTEYFQGEISIAPDGSKLAFVVARNSPGAQMHVIDLRTGMESIFPVRGHDRGVRLSWSPDGRRIAFDIVPESYGSKNKQFLPEIEILDLETGKSAKIADGDRPAWSPSGEWIAHFDRTPDRKDLREGGGYPRGANQLVLVRPNGTDSKVVLTFGGGRALAASPVWSPDSKTILLNEWRSGEKGTMDIHLLDLTTLELARKFKDTLPVYGWAEVK